MGQGNALGNCYHPSAPPEGACCVMSKLLTPGALRPLLCGIEPHFAELADSTGRIEASALRRVWQQGAEKKLGGLSQDDMAVMEAGVESYFEAKTLSATSRVNYVDFVSFLLDGNERCSNDGTVISRLRQIAASDPQAFSESVLGLARSHQESQQNVERESFGSFDATQVAKGDNSLDEVRVTRTEFARCLQDLLPFDNLNDPSSVGRPSLASVANEVDQVIEVTSHDGRLDLYNGLANTLDRRKIPVELVLYDISHGVSRLFSHALLGRSFEAIYHSSVLVFGTEFWYGGQVFENEPPIDPNTFGPPLSHSLEQLQPSVYNSSIRTVHLGSTLATLFELREFLQEHMKPKYRPDNYDVLTHNCNCFSEDVVRFLTGKGIPESVRRLPELVMDTPGATLLRPFLNRWLRSFQAQSDSSKDAGVSYSSDQQSPKESEEECVAWEKAISAVTADGSIDLGYFDPTQATTLTRKSVRRSSVMREESGRLIRPKSGEEVTFREESRRSYVEDKPSERKDIRRSAIRRLVDGSMVQARVV